MQHIQNFITEKLIINKNTKIKTYNYHLKDKDELRELVLKLIKERGNEADLNDIDTSQITDMSWLFNNSQFNGNISKWAVSNVEDMNNMFSFSDFNGDISEWDVRNVKYMFGIFSNSKFDGDINDWDVKKTACSKDMFQDSPLEKNPPQWFKK